MKHLIQLASASAKTKAHQSKALHSALFRFLEPTCSSEVSTCI